MKKIILSLIVLSGIASAKENSYVLKEGLASSPSYILFHGDTRSAESFAKYTKFKPKNSSVLFLNAPKKTWHIHDNKKFKTNKKNAIQLITQLQKQKKLSKNIILVGMSTGGLIASDIACNSPLKPVGLVTVSSSLQQDFNCKRPLKTMSMHGTKDPFVKYNKDKSFKGIKLLSGKSGLIKWSQINGCDSLTHTKIDTDKKDNTSVDINNHNNCNQPYISYTVNGGGHTWPGLKNKFIAKKIIGLSTNEIKANKIITNYFNQ